MNNCLNCKGQIENGFYCTNCLKYHSLLETILEDYKEDCVWKREVLEIKKRFERFEQGDGSSYEKIFGYSKEVSGHSQPDTFYPLTVTGINWVTDAS